jgi:hypothetical protein
MSEKEIEDRLRRQINPAKETNQKNIYWFWDNVNSELLTKIINLKSKSYERNSLLG